MRKQNLAEALIAIHQTMTENKAYLIELDARFGDGDLGLTMESGFESLCAFMQSSELTDLGQLLLECSKEFNKAAPSTLGTLLSLALMAMAKSLKGKDEASVSELADAIMKGVEAIMQRAGSTPGEKTILDSIHPAAAALKGNASKGAPAAFQAAFNAAEQGWESTKQMVGKHGRIAYYGEKTLGYVDAGATAGMLIFKALSEFLNPIDAVS